MAQGLFNLTQVNQAVRQGAWTTGIKPTAVDYLVVAGGGGGGLAGGGAGGFLTGQTPVVSGSSITVTIGAGGSGASGSNSVFGSIAATGGGGAGGNPGNGSAGGSGGGTYFGNNNVPGQGTFLQGNVGSKGNSSGGSGGGGGGAGSPATDAISINTGGIGGSGVASALSGTVTAYAGGAGGYGSSYGGTGGTGGGGNGPTAGGSGTAGTANTGGGGGGSTGGGGLSGGSGIVVISYPDTFAAPTSTTGSPTVSTSGSGSVVFSGTSQYLSTPSNSGFNFGTGDFTIECWFNSSNVGISQKGFIQTSATAGGLEAGYTTGVSINFSGSGTNTIGANVGSASYFSSSNAVTTGTWYHVAITRQSGTVNVWLNGVSVASGSGNTSNLSGTYCVVGGYYNTSYLYNGYLSNVRIIKGTALYTTSFTPSTVPLTAISGTSLLMNTVSGAQFADGSSNALALTSTGSPTWNALSPFTSTGYKNRVYTWTSSGSITF